MVGAGHSGGQAFHEPGTTPWPNTCTIELRTFSITQPLCDSVLTDTKDYPSEKFPTKLPDIHSHTEKMPVLYNQTILHAGDPYTPNCHNKS